MNTRAPSPTPAAAEPRRGGAAAEPARAGRTLAGLVVVLLTAAVALQGLDRLPGLLAGLPRGAVRVATLDELTRALGEAVPLPVYYPSDLEWPPADLRLYPGPSAVIIVHSRESGAPALLIAALASGVAAAPSAPLPPVVVLQTSESTFGGRRATVARVQDGSGAIWHEASWSVHGRTMVVRYRGDLLGLSRMVEGMAR